MSRISNVIKNKNKIEKARRARQKDELLHLRETSVFKAKLYDKINQIEMLFSEDSVNAIIITVPDESLNYFTNAVYSEDLAGYIVEQVPEQYNKFVLRRKFVAI